MKKNNRGFTLIELLVSITIFGIVVASVFGFMLASSHAYSSVSSRLNLQLQSELATNQIGSYIIDCNACLYYDNNKLYIINKNTDGSFTANVFERRADNCIYFGTGGASQNVNGNFTCTVAASDVLTEDVTSFTVTPTNNSTNTRIISAEVSIVFEKNSVMRNENKTLALRNMPAIATVSTS